MIFADQLMYTGFAQSTASGASIGVEDFVIPQAKAKIIGDAEAEVKEIESQYASGLVTQGEKYNKVVDIWSRANDLVARSMMDGISQEKVVNRDGKDEDQASFNSRVHLCRFGRARFAGADPPAGGYARSDDATRRQHHRNADHRELPRRSHRNEYFISTHGARKGLADTALKTANSGYLTRRLVDVAQDLVITDVDCGTAKVCTSVR